MTLGPRASTSTTVADHLGSIGGALLFCSGAFALVYQTVWLRELRVIFGASTSSTSAVLALFLGGLGLGGWLLGPHVERATRPLRLYGVLELGVAVLAGVSPFVLDGVHRAYLAAGGRSGLGGLAVPVQVALGALVLLGPTLAMGGTLPAMARAITATSDLGRRGLAAVYGWNTVGAVAGTLATTFFLFEALGLRATLWCAAALNALLGMTARALDRSLPPIDAPAPPPPSTTTKARTPRAVLGAAFVCGFAFLAFELVWSRLLSSLLGGSSYSFNVVLAMALLGIGAGGLAYARRAASPSWSLFALTVVVEAALLLAPLAVGDDLPFFAFALRQWGQASFATTMAGWCVLLVVVVLPGAVVSGFQFPLLIALAGRARDGVAVDAGAVYAANTLGSIAGSMLCGFALIPALGAWHAAGVAALALVVVGAVVLVRERRPLLAVVVVVVIGALAAAPGPGVVWRGTSVGAGRAPLAAGSANDRRAIVAALQAAQQSSTDGVESGIVVQDADGLSLLVNGKSDGNTIADAQTTVGAVLLPALLHGAPRSGFVVGLGAGQSAGWLAAVPTMQKVTVVEMEPRVVDFAAACAATNQGVVGAAKVELVVGDGREALQTSTETYDVIMSEPSNPYRAGVAGFYSTDFYDAALRRLSADGLFAQWIQGYDVDAATIQTAVATMRSVFANVTIWRTSSSDLLLLAGRHAPTFDVDAVAARLAVEPWKTGFGRIYWFTTPADVATLLVADDRLSERLARAWRGGLNSDDLPLLEYAFARNVARASGSVLAELDALSARLGTDALAATRGALDWNVVRAHRGRHAWPLGAGGARPVDAADLVAAGAFDAARAAIRAQTTAPTHPGDALMELRALVVDHAAADDDALVAPRLAVVTTYGLTAEARLVELQRALTLQRDVPERFGAFVDALHDDPWLAPGLVDDAAGALLAGARATPAAAALLAAPFAGARLGQARREALLAIHARDVDAGCVAFFVDAGAGLPWRDDALLARARCFAKHAPERLADADAALRAFRASAPTRFVIDALPAASP